MDTRNPQSNRVANRWTEKVLAFGGFTPVANLFLTNYSKLEVKPAEAMLVVHILRHRWGHSSVSISTTRLAEEMGLSLSQVRSKIRKLEGLKLIERSVKRGQASEFDIQGLLVRLHQLIEEQSVERELDFEEFEQSIDQRASGSPMPPSVEVTSNANAKTLVETESFDEGLDTWPDSTESLHS